MLEKNSYIVSNEIYNDWLIIESFFALHLVMHGNKSLEEKKQ